MISRENDKHGLWSDYFQIFHTHSHTCQELVVQRVSFVLGISRSY